MSVHKNKTTSSLPFKKGFLITINSINKLTNLLLGTNEIPGLFNFVMARRFNQDCVENIFCQIRRDKGSFFEMPESWRAIANLKYIACSLFLTPLSKFSNCEDDDCKTLLNPFNQNYFKSCNIHISSETSNWNFIENIENVDSITAVEVTNIFYHVSLMINRNIVESDISEYIAGYCLKKLFKK